MDTPQITDKTYTLNSEKSYYDRNNINLKIFLPADVLENPYEYTIFDMSQLIDSVQYNALFVYFKKTDDDATDLSGNDDDRQECSCSFEFSELLQLTELEHSSPFDPDADNALVVIYHDLETGKPYKRSCAEEIFPQVFDITASVIANGNFQTDMSLMGGQPKKSGMSLIPRH